MSRNRNLPLGVGETARTACAPGLLRTAVVEETGEVLSASVLAERADWAARLASGMAVTLIAAHWNAADVDVLASGVDAEGRALPSNAWMALRRLGWAAAPPTIPANAILHLPALRIRQGRVRADLAYTHPVPKAARSGHTVALGVDWGLSTMLSAGPARLHDDGRITALGAGGMFRAAGILARQHRLRRHSERLHAKADQYQRLIGEDRGHPLAASTGPSPARSGAFPTGGRTSMTPLRGPPPGGRRTRPSPPAPR